MIVEDSGIIVQRLYSMLSEVEFIKSIVHAKNGEEAITLLKLLSPELVLLDIKLPVMNGIEVLRHIKRDYKNIQVVMLTNYPNSQYKEICMELGADYFLDKSTDFEQIIKLMHSMHSKMSIS